MWMQLEQWKDNFAQVAVSIGTGASSVAPEKIIHDVSRSLEALQSNPNSMNPFRCEKCSLAFASIDTLQEHQSASHDMYEDLVNQLKEHSPLNISAISSESSIKDFPETLRAPSFDRVQRETSEFFKVTSAKDWTDFASLYHNKSWLPDKPQNYEDLLTEDWWAHFKSPPDIPQSLHLTAKPKEKRTSGQLVTWFRPDRTPPQDAVITMGPRAADYLNGREFPVSSKAAEPTKPSLEPGSVVVIVKQRHLPGGLVNEIISLGGIPAFVVEAAASFETDSSRESCSKCSKKFKTQKGGKHHCRGCGQMVCGPCSQNRYKLLRFGFTVPVRLCVSCFNNALSDELVAWIATVKRLSKRESKKKLMKFLIGHYSHNVVFERFGLAVQYEDVETAVLCFSSMSPNGLEKQCLSSPNAPYSIEKFKKLIVTHPNQDILTDYAYLIPHETTFWFDVARKTDNELLALSLIKEIYKFATTPQLIDQISKFMSPETCFISWWISSLVEALGEIEDDNHRDRSKWEMRTKEKEHTLAALQLARTANPSFSVSEWCSLLLEAGSDVIKQVIPIWTKCFLTLFPLTTGSSVFPMPSSSESSCFTSLHFPYIEIFELVVDRIATRNERAVTYATVLHLTEGSSDAFLLKLAQSTMQGMMSRIDSTHDRTIITGALLSKLTEGAVSLRDPSAPLHIRLFGEIFAQQPSTDFPFASIATDLVMRSEYVLATVVFKITTWLTHPEEIAKHWIWQADRFDDMQRKAKDIDDEGILQYDIARLSCYLAANQVVPSFELSFDIAARLLALDMHSWSLIMLGHILKKYGDRLARASLAEVHFTIGKILRAQDADPRLIQGAIRQYSSLLNSSNLSLEAKSMLDDAIEAIDAQKSARTVSLGATANPSVPLPAGASLDDMITRLMEFWRNADVHSASSVIKDTHKAESPANSLASAIHLFLRASFTEGSNSKFPSSEEVSVVSRAVRSLCDAALASPTESVIIAATTILSSSSTCTLLISELKNQLDAFQRILDSPDSSAHAERLSFLLDSDLFASDSSDAPKYTGSIKSSSSLSDFALSEASALQLMKDGPSHVACAYLDLVRCAPHPSIAVQCYINASRYFIDAARSTNDAATTHSYHLATISAIIAAGDLSKLLSPTWRVSTSRSILSLLVSIPTRRASDNDLLWTTMERLVDLLATFPIVGFATSKWAVDAIYIYEVSTLLYTRVLGVTASLNAKQPHSSPTSLALSRAMYDGILNRWIQPYVEEVTTTVVAKTQSCLMLDLCAERNTSLVEIEKLLQYFRISRDADGFREAKSSKSLSSDFSFSTLDGFSFDPTTGNLSIIATKSSDSGSDPLFGWCDIAEALRYRAHNVSVTTRYPKGHIDPSPFQEINVNDPVELSGTGLVQSLVCAIGLLESLASGIEFSAKAPYATRSGSAGLVARLPPHLQEAVKSIPARCKSSILAPAYQVSIEVGDVEINKETRSPNVRILFGQVPIQVVVYGIRNNSSVCIANHRVCDRIISLCRSLSSFLLFFSPHSQIPEESTEAAEFASSITKHFLELGEYFPELLRVRELAKLVVLGQQLHAIVNESQPSESEREAKLQQLILESEAQVLSSINEADQPWPQAEENIDLKVDESLESAREGLMSIPSNQLSWSALKAKLSPKWRSRLLIDLEKDDAALLDQVTARFSRAGQSDDPQARPLAEQFLRTRNPGPLAQWVAVKKLEQQSASSLLARLTRRQPPTDNSASTITPVCSSPLWVPAIHINAGSNFCVAFFGGASLSVSVRTVSIARPKPPSTDFAVTVEVLDAPRRRKEYLSNVEALRNLSVSDCLQLRQLEDITNISQVVKQAAAQHAKCAQRHELGSNQIWSSLIRSIL
jgi:hypothetical protein